MAMKVLLLSAASSVHTMRWANAFGMLGHEVHLASQHEPLQGYSSVREIHLLPHRSGAGYLLNGPRLRQLVCAVRPDVVNAHYATGYGTLARALRGVPVVLNVWGSDVYEFPEKSPFHRWWLRRNLRSAHRLVSTSEVMADRTHQWVPELPRPTVVPFGVNSVQFSPRPNAYAGRERIVIGTVKTLAKKYGIDTLIEAFALLQGRPGMENVRLEIVGTGPDLAALRHKVEAAGMKGLVEFTGGIPHDAVPGQLHRFDVFVALSREDSESFGVSVIEASACGLPVVVSDAGGLPEVVVNEATGVVVPRNDPAAAAEQMWRLIHSAEVREQWGKAGREHVMKNYEWSACVERMVKVLETTVAEYRRR